MFTLAELRTEITTDPEGIGYDSSESSVKTCLDIASLLSDRTRRSKPTKTTQRLEIKNNLIVQGKLIGIHKSDKDSATLAKFLFADPDFTSIDQEWQSWEVAMDGLVSDGFLSVEDVQSLKKLQEIPCSRSEELWNVSQVDWAEVAQAMDWHILGPIESLALKEFDSLDRRTPPESVEAWEWIVGQGFVDSDDGVKFTISEKGQKWKQSYVGKRVI